MDINTQKCPNCAGTLQTDIEKRMKTCPFCGAVFYIEGRVDPSSNSAEIQTEMAIDHNIYDIRLIKIGPNKVNAIKIYRELSGLGLKESKEILDAAPCILFKGLDKSTAERYAAELRSNAPGILVEVV